MKRIFYRISGEMKCSDCSLIKETSDINIYRIIDQNIKAIKYNPSTHKNKSKILFHNNNIEPIDVGHIREKDKKYEQYIVGRVGENNSELDIYGEIKDKVWSKSNEIKLKINDLTVAVGSVSIDDDYWHWSLDSPIDNIKASLHGYSNISDFYGGKRCVVVSSDNPINSVVIHPK